MSRPQIRQVLFDFDGVLAHYSHELRIARLAQFAYAEHERVREVLFTSGLETEYDGGLIDTDTYLGRLGAGIGAVIDIETWIGSRVAGSHADDTVLRHIHSSLALAPDFLQITRTQVRNGADVLVTEGVVEAFGAALRAGDPDQQRPADGAGDPTHRRPDVSASRRPRALQRQLAYPQART